MEVTIQLFGPARRLADADVFVLTLNDNATVGDAVDAMSASNADLAAMLPTCAIAVGEDIVALTHALANGDDVAVLPPVNGG